MNRIGKERHKIKPVSNLHSSSPHAEFSRPRQSILIVDDKRENLVALRMVLSDLDVEVVEATSGNEALAATLDKHFAAAILDVMMPSMDGYELAAVLRTDKATRMIPILFITASFEDAQHEFKGYEAGAIDYIMKPFKPQILLGKLRILLELDHYRQELLLHRDHLEALIESRTMELREQVREKEALLREIHHRVKNNLQIISSLFTLQIEQAGDRSPEEIFRTSLDRVRSIALVHEKLYSSRNLSQVNLDQCLPALASNLCSSCGITPGRISITFACEPCTFPINSAVPLVMIVNELLTNAMKHAFPDGRAGEIRISLTARRAPAYELTVADDGVGLPADFDAKNQKSLGLQLVTMLVKQLDGTLAIESRDGTSVSIIFNNNEKTQKQS